MPDPISKVPRARRLVPHLRLVSTWPDRRAVCRGLCVIAFAAFALTSCSSPTPRPTSSPAPSPAAGELDATRSAEAEWVATAGPSQPLEVTLGLPFQPDVQFAPIYVALERGAWADRGLSVSVEYGDETDLLRRVASHQMLAVIAGGDQVLLARDQGLPVKYVATWHHRFPVAIFGTDANVDTPAELVGKTVGVPMLGGVTALGLRALLADAGIDDSLVSTEVVGFNQLQAVLGGQVDAAAGYAVNEPVRLRGEGHEVGVIEVADFVNLVANGLVVSDASVADHPDLAQRLVDGFLDGIEYSLDNPDEAFAIALRAVPEAADPAQVDAARSVFDESLRFWAPPGAIGAIDGQQWAESARIMFELGLLESEPDVAAAVDARFAERHQGES